MLERLVLGMDRARFDSVVISMLDEGNVGPRLRKRGVEVVALEMKRGIPSPRSVPKLVRTLRQFKPDVLQTWLYHADLLGLIAGAACRVPAVYWNIRCADVDLASYPRSLTVVRGALARLSRFPDAVVVNSEHGRRFHESIGYHPRRWEVIPNGFDTDVFRPRPELRLELRRQLNIPQDARVVGLVARFDVMKDHPNFLHAARRAADRDDRAHFVLVGRGIGHENRTLSTMIRELRLDRRCTLLGERTDIPELHSVFDVAALSSRGEGFPNSVGEAMACGVPCAATNVGDAHRLIGETGRIVPAQNPDALGAAIAELIGLSPDALHALGQEARERIVRTFGLRSVLSRYESLYATA